MMPSSKCDERKNLSLDFNKHSSQDKRRGCVFSCFFSRALFYLNYFVNGSEKLRTRNSKSALSSSYDEAWTFLKFRSSRWTCCWSVERGITKFIHQTLLYTVFFCSRCGFLAFVPSWWVVCTYKMASFKFNIFPIINLMYTRSKNLW